MILYYLLVLIVCVFVGRRVIGALRTDIGQPARARRWRERSPDKAVNSKKKDEDVKVVIVGGGIAGVAVAAALNVQGIESVVLERSAYAASSWRSHYDRLHLHTSSWVSHLPYLKFPSSYPVYISRQQVVDYITGYVTIMNVNLKCNQSVVRIDNNANGWEVETVDTTNNTKKMYRPKFVIVATGKNTIPISPTFANQDQYKGRLLHSTQFKSAEEFSGKSVLVVGFGNSGGELAIDCWEHDCRTHILVRSPVNIVKRQSVLVSTLIGRFLPKILRVTIEKILYKVDYGDLAKYGITCPNPKFHAEDNLKINGIAPVIDIGQIELIRSGAVKVIKHEIARFTQQGVLFQNGQEEDYDVVILATGSKSNLDEILSKKVYEAAVDTKGFPLPGENATFKGLYIIGWRDDGGRFRAISKDALVVAADIKKKLKLV